MHELGNALLRFSQISLGTFKSVVNNILQKHGPIKKRYVRVNQASFINSKIHKEVMRRTCLRNEFIDSKTQMPKLQMPTERL